MAEPIHPNGDPNEPDRSFRDAMIKVAWAEQIINQLNTNVERLFESYRESARQRANDETRGFDIDNASIPPWVALMAGDAVFNLRSSLDCCWMGLRRAIKTPPKDRGVKTLPRGDTWNDVKGTFDQTPVEQAFQGAERLLRDTVKAYRDGNEVLWLGGKVDNWNKHNMLVTTLKQTHVRELSGTWGGAIFEATNNKFVGNAKFFGEGSAPLHLHGEPDLTFDIILESREPIDKRLLLPFLTTLLKDTHEAVQAFAREFGKPAS